MPLFVAFTPGRSVTSPIAGRLVDHQDRSPYGSSMELYPCIHESAKEWMRHDCSLNVPNGVIPGPTPGALKGLEALGFLRGLRLAERESGRCAHVLRLPVFSRLPIAQGIFPEGVTIKPFTNGL